MGSHQDSIWGSLWSPFGNSNGGPCGIPLGVPCWDSLCTTHPRHSVHAHCTLCMWTVKKAACMRCVRIYIVVSIYTLCTLHIVEQGAWLQEDGAWQRMTVTAGNTWIRQMGAAFDKHSAKYCTPSSSYTSSSSSSSLAFDKHYQILHTSPSYIPPHPHPHPREPPHPHPQPHKLCIAGGRA